MQMGRFNRLSRGTRETEQQFSGRHPGGLHFSRPVPPALIAPLVDGGPLPRDPPGVTHEVGGLKGVLASPRSCPSPPSCRPFSRTEERHQKESPRGRRREEERQEGRSVSSSDSTR